MSTTVDSTIDRMIETGRAAQSEGRWDDAISAYRNALTASRSAKLSCAELLRRIGQVHCHRGEFKEAEAIYEQSLAAARESGDRQHIASALNSQAVCQQSLGRLERAEGLFREAQRIAEEIGNRRLAVMIEQNLGTISNIRGDVTKALDRYKVALSGYEELEDEQGLVWVLNNLGMAYVDVERWGDAERVFNRALSLAERRRDADMIGTVQVNRSELYVKQQRFDEARACCDQAFEIFGRLESSWGLGETYKAYGIIYRESGKLHLADAHLELVIELAQNTSNALLEAEAQHERALVALARGKNREALKALNASQRMFTQLSATRELLDIEKRLDRLEGSYLQVVAVWAESIESKDAYTAGHCRRVAAYTTRLAEELGFSGRELTWIRMGAFLHDVGKTAVPAEVLNKPGKLDAREWEVMKNHTVAGDEIVAELDFPYDVRPMVRSHHERWDGRGYPDGLAGTQIPLSARILNVADVFDALTTTRSYRPAYNAEDALRIMREDAGTGLDPKLFGIFEQLVRSGSLRLA